MTTDPVSTTKSRFDAALVNYQTARAAAASVEQSTACHARDRIFALLDHTTDTLINTPAPSLGAIATKLECLFGEALFDEYDPRSEAWRFLIGDLRLAERMLLEFEEPDLSGGMDLTQLAADWAENLREYVRWSTLLQEGPSDAWGHSKRADIVALMDEAEAKLLSMHAPDLNAVCMKLKLLTLTYSDDLDQRTGLLLALRDVRRLATTQVD
jgi:hypothetical protein